MDKDELIRELAEAIRKHKRDVWGDDGVVHHSDDEQLYQVLSRIPPELRKP